jgi:endo-1,4-beta-mannosidase
VESAFDRLDSMMRLATDYDFRLIVTLNDMPDLVALYDNPQYIQEQTRFIINRYQNEPAILAWDLRNEGDIDYGSRSILQTQVPRTQVLQWLKETSALVRSIDSNHLLTAGWLNEAHSTAPYVDFISFHHWTSANDLEHRIRALHLTTSKPILLQEVGYSTHHANITPQGQADLLETIIQTSEEQGLLGWMIWTAFDFPITATCYPSPCQSPDNAEHDFGIWTVDYVPKPAVEMIRQYTIH